MDDDAEAAKAEFGYLKMIFGFVPLVQTGLATATYFVLSRLLGMQDTLDDKFAFLHKYDLGYVYLAVFITFQGRNRIMVNTNAARAGAHVDRPDQHAYETKDGTPVAPLISGFTASW